jgi:hypothetical protein
MEEWMVSESLKWIAIVVTSSLFIAYWVIRMANKRGDEALLGVLRGVPISTGTRRMLLFTHYIGLGAFLVAFLVIITLVLLELATSAEQPAVANIGYTAVVLWVGGIIYLLVTVAAWVYHARSIIREAEAASDSP